MTDPDGESYETFQSTLPARGATNNPLYEQMTFLISIHAPRTGSDLVEEYKEAPTPISIHAPRTGSDGERWRTAVQPPHFNPRSPHGERQSWKN